MLARQKKLIQDTWARVVPIAVKVFLAAYRVPRG